LHQQALQKSTPRIASYQLVSPHELLFADPAKDLLRPHIGNDVVWQDVECQQPAAALIGRVNYKSFVCS
jgi:hypothetical protein